MLFRLFPAFDMTWLTHLLTLLATTFLLAVWAVLPWPGAVVLALLFAIWLWGTRVGGQARSVAAVGFATVPLRLGSSAVIVVGIAGVVGVLVALLAMAEGYRQTVRATGDEHTVVVMRSGSASELSSTLDRNSTSLVEQTEGIARNAAGEALVSAEIVVAASLPIANGGPDEEGSVQFRGVGPRALGVRPQVKIVAGRMFQTGLRELVVGRGAARQFVGLVPGKEVQIGGGNWTVAGVFDSGDALSSEIWGDANVVADSYRRGSSRNSVTIRLERPEAYETLKVLLASNPRLHLKAETTLEYFSKQSERATKVLTLIGISVGSIMAVGAVFGALNRMFAAVSSRAREIATLRAIGFPGLPVVVAVLLETMLLALAGGVVGGLVAWTVFDKFQASTMGAGTAGQLAFMLRVTPELLWTGLKWAIAIGFVGGLFPAIRAARLPVTAALREL